MVTIDFRNMKITDNGPTKKAYKFRLMSFVRSKVTLSLVY